MEVLKLCKSPEMVSGLSLNFCFMNLGKKAPWNLGFHEQLVGSKKQRNGSWKQLNK